MKAKSGCVKKFKLKALLLASAAACAAIMIVLSAKQGVAAANALPATTARTQGTGTRFSALDAYGRLPIGFELNRGQSDPRSGFSHAAGDTRFF
jgi:hypothetical protein